MIYIYIYEREDIINIIIVLKAETPRPPPPHSSCPSALHCHSGPHLHLLTTAPREASEGELYDGQPLLTQIANPRTSGIALALQYLGTLMRDNPMSRLVWQQQGCSSMDRWAYRPAANAGRGRGGAGVGME